MTLPRRSDLAWGGALLLLATVLLAQLLLGDAGGGFQLAARVLRLVLVLALAGLFLTTRDLVAMGVAAGAVALLVLTATIGLLVAPEQFVGTGRKAPDTPAEAQALGLVLTVLLVGVAVFVLRRWWRYRRSPAAGVPGEPGEDRAYGG